MQTIEIARRMAELGETKKACAAYGLAIHESGAQEPAVQLEGAVYMLQNGGDYKVSYSCLLDLFRRDCYQEECLSIMTQAFYEPNVKQLKSRYKNNCKLLEKYPYLFRKDFIDFEFLPQRFYPFDDNRFVPYIVNEKRFGDYIDFKKPVVSRNFFNNLEKPIFAQDVFSQYELEYLNDNVRKSEDIGTENHVYLYYPDWGVFCSHLQCLNMRPLLASKKIVFLIGDEKELYPIDFQERFHIDYSQYQVKPVSLHEVKKIIWHTQLSTHNGGDFFNEIFDAHPNLLSLTSVMFDNIEERIETWKEVLASAKHSKEVKRAFLEQKDLNSWVLQELCNMPSPTDKDIFVAFYLSNKTITQSLDPNSRIVPPVFFQPHFHNIAYELNIGLKGRTELNSKQRDKIQNSPIFRGFKYIKTFTPMRRPTTSHGAAVKFMYKSAQEETEKRELSESDEKKISVVADSVSQCILNRSFMIDWQDRLFADSVLVRFEDGKMNPRAVFTALAAFLDLPYTKSMTYCSLNNQINPESMEGNVLGFDTATVYRTYDEFANDNERKYIEYFLRDAYKFYGYDFHYYDDKPVTLEEIKEWTSDFSKMDYYIRETWKKVYDYTRVKIAGEDKEADAEATQTVKDKLLENHLEKFRLNRNKNAEILMRGLNFVNKNGQPLHMMPLLKLDPELLEQPLYH